MDSEAKIKNLQEDKQNSDVDAGSKDGLDHSSRPSSGSRSNLSALHKEREERIRHLKEQQNEERQRKLEELKQQALAAQKFREQKEEERRKRMEELRNRENDRRQQVEERKRLIWEAEKERREYIVRKNHERETRIENKRKNERGQIAFAFGSSTPRLIETVDCSGMGMSASFWATRRATSISNVAMNNSTTVTRRSCERELGETKKRATSASGLDRQTDGLRSGEMTPTSTYSRPGSAMSSSTTASGVVYRRSTPSARKPRPASIAITGVTPGVTKDGDLSQASGGEKRPPLPRQSTSRKSSASNTPKEPKVSRTPGMVTPKGGTPAAIQSPDSTVLGTNKSLERSFKAAQSKAQKLPAVGISEPDKPVELPVAPVVKVVETEPPTDVAVVSVEVKTETTVVEVKKDEEPKKEEDAETSNTLDIINGDNEMTASMIAKSKINTEEEAKAALAERRRLAREEAERQAELERQRIEAEEAAERQRQLDEEERLRKLEEETIRLAEEQRRLEEERLQAAIEDAQKREEEERQKQEEESRLKAEKEEQERKAREEAEKQRIEMQEKLKQEEMEREARRKRVEAIMQRTRNKGSATNTPQKNAESDDKVSSPMTDSQIAMSQSLTESMIQEIKGTTDASSTKEDKDFSKLQNFIANEKHENEKENSVNNGASAPQVEHQIQSSDSSSVVTATSTTTPIPTTRIESDLLIEDSIGHTNGHGNGTLEDKLKSKPVESKIANADLITDQLIDLNNFNSDVQLTNNSINFSNNNNNNNNSLTNTTPLVASDSQDNRDLSLL